MYNICYHTGILGVGKISSSGAKIGTLVSVVPYVIVVASGVCGIDLFTSYTQDSVINISW